MQLSGRLRLNSFVFITELPRVFENLVGNDVARFDPTFGLQFVVGPHPVPTLLPGVVARVRNIHLIQNVDQVAAVYFKQVRRHDCRRAEYLRASRHHDAGVAFVGERAASGQQQRRQQRQRTGEQRPSPFFQLHMLFTSVSSESTIARNHCNPTLATNRAAACSAVR